MAGKGQFPPRRENTHGSAVRRIVRRQDEHGFGQVELAGNLLHLRVRKACRLKDNGQRIAGQTVGGKDIIDGILARHFGTPLIGN